MNERMSYKCHAGGGFSTTWQPISVLINGLSLIFKVAVDDSFN